jgi:uncharacterized protein (DUF952 family)
MQTLIDTLKNPTEDGLYSLKALCASTGDYEKYKPFEFLRLTSTKRYLKRSNEGKSLVSEQIIRTTQGGNGDTFVNKRLVYRYAMWVSDDFYDLVIDTFDALQAAQTEAEILDVKRQLVKGQQDLIIRNPIDPNSLSSHLKIPPSKLQPYFAHLVSIGELAMKLIEQPPKVEYLATDNSKFVIGKKGKTILFDERVKTAFPEQQTFV